MTLTINFDRQQNHATFGPFPSVDEYLWPDGPRCRACGGIGKAMTVNGLVFIVRCSGCEAQACMERCEVDALHAWEKRNA